MKVKKIAEEVYEIKDFLTKEELLQVAKIIDSLSESDWLSDDTPLNEDPSDFWYGKTVDFQKDTVFDLVNKKIKDLFESFAKYPDNILLQRYTSGQSIRYHRDVWNIEEPFYVSYGVLLYYNDNYSGGEINFKDQNIRIKPTAGSIVIFPSVEPFYHESMPILNGTKYMSPAFWHLSD
jgi:predicted 2-oxoglutarate/Fe(II)-dependent dioxygenase YbiX